LFYWTETIPCGSIFLGQLETRPFRRARWGKRHDLRVGCYQWVNGKQGWPNRKDWMYGAGVEVGPKDIGLGGIIGNRGIRLRFQTETYDFDSFRPTAGVIFHF
jgi:hypothetical protein